MNRGGCVGVVMIDEAKIMEVKQSKPVKWSDVWHEAGRSA
jgi:hypothetical protein